MSVTSALEEAHVANTSGGLLLEFNGGADLLVLEPMGRGNSGHIRLFSPTARVTH